MSNLTNDQYLAIHALQRWYRKYQHQVIDIAGSLGTGPRTVVREFLEEAGIDPREVMYLTPDQHEVCSLGLSGRYHVYFLDDAIYKYMRIVDWDTITVVNPRSQQLEYHWSRKVRKRINPNYKIIIVLDSSVMTMQMIEDLCSFELPIILIRDPLLLPIELSYTYREPNIRLKELSTDSLQDFRVAVVSRLLSGKKLNPGSYGALNIVSKKDLNRYNMKSNDMIITMSHDFRDIVNRFYREKILSLNNVQNISGERLIITEDLYNHKLVNDQENRLKFFLRRGLVGYIGRINRHALGTKYVPFTFKPDFYHKEFEDLILNRYHLNNISAISRQDIPDESVMAEYAYALTPEMCRTMHWDNVLFIIDDEYEDINIHNYMLYTAITRAASSLTVVL